MRFLIRAHHTTLSNFRRLSLDSSLLIFPGVLLPLSTTTARLATAPAPPSSPRPAAIPAPWRSRRRLSPPPGHPRPPPRPPPREADDLDYIRAHAAHHTPSPPSLRPPPPPQRIVRHAPFKVRAVMSRSRPPPPHRHRRRRRPSHKKHTPTLMSGERRRLSLVVRPISVYSGGVCMSYLVLVGTRHQLSGTWCKLFTGRRAEMRMRLSTELSFFIGCEYYIYLF